LIPTRSLPPLSYEIPEHLRPKVGSVVVAPLSGRSRLGVVVGFDPSDERATESLVSVWEEVSLPEETVRLCEWVAEQTAVSPAAALRAALPPGIEADKYRIVRPRRGWKWSEGDLITRAELKRALGETAMKAAEAVGRIELSPRLAPPRKVEWAVRANGHDPDFGRAHRQREVFEALCDGGGEMLVSSLLSGAGASRAVLRSLADRRSVRIEHRPPEAPVVASSGHEFSGGGRLRRGVLSALGKGGASLWRLPTGEFTDAVAEMAGIVTEDGGTMLVLAPEVRMVDLLVDVLERKLPAGTRVAAYHGGVGKERAEVWRAARRGDVEVLVGTRAAALVPMADLGGICVADEPNEAHRAEPGYEGLPIHARELALRRAGIEDVPVLFLSPTPSLRLYASGGFFEVPARGAPRWPSVRLVDMRGSGATLSSTLVSDCRDVLDAGERVGVVVDRLGYATAVSCLNCGKVRSCAKCDIPLSLHDRGKTLTCARCGRREKFEETCRECGSRRVTPTGMAVESVRERLSELFGEEAGLLTANERELEDDARIVVGTARPILSRRWGAIAFPDADSFLAGGWMNSVERAFRVFHGAGESAQSLVVAQTRNPEHYALRAALREDYPAFADAEIPRLRRFGYPPFAHFASLVVRGGGEAVRHAVKSLPDFDGVEVSKPVPAPSGWRVLMRSRSKEAVARAANTAARRLSKPQKEKSRRAGRLAVVKVEIDPEEV
jgi:primosomal protein N' (replication factor Y) (superfamily II helicase)